MRIIGCLCFIFLFAFSAGCAEDDKIYPNQKDAVPWKLPDKGVAQEKGAAKDGITVDKAVVTPDKAVVTPDKAVVTPDKAVVTPDKAVTPG